MTFKTFKQKHHQSDDDYNQLAGGHIGVQLSWVGLLTISWLNTSLCQRRNLTLFSKVSETVPRYFFHVPNSGAFQISFQPDWQIDKTAMTSGNPEQGFWCCFTDGLSLSIVLSVGKVS